MWFYYSKQPVCAYGFLIITPKSAIILPIIAQLSLAHLVIIPPEKSHRTRLVSRPYFDTYNFQFNPRPILDTDRYNLKSRLLADRGRAAALSGLFCWNVLPQFTLDESLETRDRPVEDFNRSTESEHYLPAPGSSNSDLRYIFVNFMVQGTIRYLPCY